MGLEHHRTGGPQGPLPGTGDLLRLGDLAVGAWQAGWYGGPTTPQLLWPIAIVAGGLLQVIAAVACLRARDGLAVAVHAVWGSFWIGWSILQLLVTTHTASPIPLGATSTALGFWFIGLTLVTASAALAAAANSGLLLVTLAALATGSAFTAAGFCGAGLGIVRAGGWLFVASAGGAWLLATAMMLENGFGRTIIPLGKWSKEANVPGGRATRPVGRQAGMPGVRVGQ